MFYTREKPWHGLGVQVMETPTSEKDLELAGLNWSVLQEPIYTDEAEVIPGYKANVRDSDRSPTFFGWVFGFGEKVQILGSESVKEQYKQMIVTANENLM